MIKRLLYTLAFLFATMQTFAQTYTYDSNNRLKKVVYSNGTTITYTFDALGNRISKKVTGSTAATYTISASVTPTGSGSVSGTGKYNSGSSIELNAIANAGYEFLKWSDGVTDNPRTITVTQDQSLTAQFVESTITSDMSGDIVVDGKVDTQDLNALMEAYLSGANATNITDLDGDKVLSITDITQLISIINPSGKDRLTKVVEGTIYCLRKELMDKNDVRVNADNNPYYRTRLMLDVTKEGSKKSYEIGDYIYIAENDSNFCLEFDLKNRMIIVFANSKSSGNNYRMEGYAFVSSFDNLSFSKENVFSSSNWGWFPYFVDVNNQNTVIHFSYAGYYQMQSTRNSDGTWTTNNNGSKQPNAACEDWKASDPMLVVGSNQ